MISARLTYRGGRFSHRYEWAQKIIELGGEVQPKPELVDLDIAPPRSPARPNSA
jgi:hypothetical protein